MQQPFPTTMLFGADYNPEQWPEGVWADDMRLMKLAHANMASINIFSWASLEPREGYYQFGQLDHIMDMLAEHGIMADLATATASPPTWMSRRYPEMLPVTWDGKRLSHGSRQHYYLATRGSDDLLVALMRELCQEAGVSPVLEASEGVEVTQRVRADGGVLYFLLNHAEKAEWVSLPAGRFISLLTGEMRLRVGCWWRRGMWWCWLFETFYPNRGV